MEKSSTVATNRKARRDYFIDRNFEAGIVLQGTEVKSVRNRRITMNESFARVEGGEVFIYNLYINQYEQGNRYNHDPVRTRKLLLHKKEIAQLIGLTQQKGYSLVPLRVYFKRGFVKVELGLGRGKKLYDKRHDIKRRDDQRDMQRALRQKNR